MKPVVGSARVQVVAVDNVLSLFALREYYARACISTAETHTESVF